MSDFQTKQLIDQIVRELQGSVRSIVKDELAAPTGVVPGVYSGLTVGRDGRVRFAEAVTSGAGGGQLIAIARKVSTTSLSGTNQIVNYNQVDFDPLSTITTGASWTFTAPQAGKYLINASLTAQIRQRTTDFWLDEFSLNLSGPSINLYYQAGEPLPFADHVFTGYATRQAQGSRVVSLSAGSTVSVTVRLLVRDDSADASSSYVPTTYLAAAGTNQFSAVLLG